jgi:hypothetical protein
VALTGVTHKGKGPTGNNSKVASGSIFLQDLRRSDAFSVKLLCTKSAKHLHETMRPVFRLYDHLGKLAMESSNGMGINEMNTQNLPPGLYFWELTSAGQRVKSGKLLKV